MVTGRPSNSPSLIHTSASPPAVIDGGAAELLRTASPASAWAAAARVASPRSNSSRISGPAMITPDRAAGDGADTQSCR